MSTTAHRLARPLSRLALLLAAILTALLIHSIWRGAPSLIVARLGKPQLVIVAITALCLASASLKAWRQASLPTLFRKLFLLGFSLGFSLLAAEIAVRIFLNHNEGEGGLAQLQKWQSGGKIPLHSFTPLLAISELTSNRRLLYGLKPNLNMDFGHHPLRTNSRGLRDSQEYDPTATNALRIAGIGDSGMFGWGVDQDQDYLSVLESNLNARANTPHVDVLNFAVPGYNTGQELEVLRHHALEFNPRVVILGWCDNDFGLPFLVTTKQDFSSRKTSFLYKALFYRKELLAKQVCKPGELDPKLVDPVLIEHTGVPGVTKALTQIRDLGREKSFHLLIFGPMQPTAVEVCRSLGLDYFNTYEKVDASKYPPDYNVHFMHPGPGGHRILAEHLQAELERRGWLN